MRQKEFIIVLGITLLVVIGWVIFDIIHSKSSVQLDPKVQNIIEPLNPSFDTKLIEEIQSSEKEK